MPNGQIDGKLALDQVMVWWKNDMKLFTKSYAIMRP